MTQKLKFNIGDIEVKIPTAAVLHSILSNLKIEPNESPALQASKTFIRGKDYPEFGGVYAGLAPGENGSPDYPIFVPTHPDAYKESIEFGSQGKDVPGAKSKSDGYTNTLALCNSEHSHPAAEWARTVVINGVEDYHLPSLRELMVCFVNVPELFEDGWYWTSTQYSADSAYMQYFGDGFTLSDFKDYRVRARVVRRFISPLTI